MPAIDAIDALLTETIAIRRAVEGGEYLRGNWRPAPPIAELTMKASVQPAPGQRLENNPEGQRTTEMVAIWVKQEIFSAETSPLLKADLIDYDGKTYEVSTVERWRGPLPHWKVVAERLEPSAPEATL